MDEKQIPEAILDIRQTSDLLVKAMKTAGIVTALFHEIGYTLVVVGGSAIEFYTEGAYMSGDLDMCRIEHAPIPLRMKQEIMGKLGATGGPRSWKVDTIFVDILGELENEAVTPLRELMTPWGKVKLIPPELLLVERVLTSVYPQPFEHDRKCAEMLMRNILTGKIDVDWKEIDRLSHLSEYNVSVELASLHEEVQRGIK